MRHRRGIPYLALTTITATVMISLAVHLDLPGRVSYAVEKGRLQADLDHLQSIDLKELVPLEQVSHAFSVIAEAVKPSVVYIEAISENTAINKQLQELFGRRNFQPEPSTGTGSGVIVDEDGHIVTNNHVVAEADAVRVILSDGRKYRAEVVGTDPKTDIAVVKIHADRLHPARFGDSSAMKVGNIVLAIGSPFRLGHSVSHGIVSAIGRSNVAVDIDYQNWIQTDAPINPGNSGGPLINARGEVIGINTAIATESGGNQGVAFAIPSKVVQTIAAKLKTGQKIVRGYLGVGIKSVDPQVASAFGLDESHGVLVEQVGAGSPADISGLKPEDIILSINGTDVANTDELQHFIATSEPNQSVVMVIWRKGERQSVKVKIGAQPDGFSTTGSLRDLLKPDSESKSGKKDRSESGRNDSRRSNPRNEPISSDDTGTDAQSSVKFDLIGMEAATMSPALAERYQLDGGMLTGAVVTYVDPTSEAYAAGIRAGHTITRANDRPIDNVRQLEQELNPDAIAKGVRLKVRWRTADFTAIIQVK